MPKTLLLTGGNGQVARAVAALAPRLTAAGYSLKRVGRPEFDFDRPETIDACFAAASPALVVNAAAWTAVDAAEAEPDAAARANDSGAARLGALCATAEIPYIHLSTDYVFDGTKGSPYVETDPPHPLNVYGATKLAGERKILTPAAHAIVLRTSWVYAAEGRNFVRAMLNASSKQDTLRVVADQRGCPTSAHDMAQAIADITTRIADGWRDNYAGIFHATCTGDATWFGFAVAIFDAAARFGHRTPKIEPIATADWPTAARRPLDTRLACDKLAKTFGLTMPDWHSSLDRTVADIFSGRPIANA